MSDPDDCEANEDADPVREAEFNADPGRTSAKFSTVRAFPSGNVRFAGAPAVVVTLHDDGEYEFSVGPHRARMLAADLIAAADHCEPWNKTENEEEFRKGCDHSVDEIERWLRGGADGSIDPYTARLLVGKLRSIWKVRP